MIKELDYPAYANAARFQRISWGAVFAGAVITLAVLAAMTSLGAGFGLITGPTIRGLSWSFGTGSAVWLLLSGVIASYAGGWMAGRLTGIALVSESVIHGLAAWGAVSLALAAVFSPTMIGGHAWTSAYDSLTAATSPGARRRLGPAVSRRA